MKIEKKQWFRPAASGREDIFSQLWVCEDKSRLRAIVQVAHGMSETVERYDDFSQFLAQHGFLVCMNEHAGHGQHAKTLGYFSEKNGAHFLTEDMKNLMDEVTTEYNADARLPVFLMGHSMGSFLAREYITQYGEVLRGVILSGTAGKNAALALGKTLARIQKKAKGDQSVGKMLTIMAFGSYCKKIENPVNRCAWLSRDEAVCIAYQQDPYCGFPFTASGFYDLFALMEEVNHKSWAAKVPKDLSIFLFSGSDDPVGGYGKGVIEVYRSLISSGHEDVTATLYPGGRHEMLNEINKEEVYADVVAWLESKID
ncbi:MAG: lysophospholipase [Clostridiales Family XIII bacterium]|jgi:alpha-beta hydrolase superfamily lysophospholipase|nr:lysophospholipase [Clostridiales Family XIII bacterium]